MSHQDHPLSSSSCPFGALPVRIEHGSSRLSAGVQLALLVPIAGSIAAGTASVAIAAATEPGLIEVARDHPLASILGVAGVATMSGLFAWPALRRLTRLLASRTVEIADGRVTVVARGLFGERRSVEALARFEGVAHHVRTEVSGARHELVLVHPVRARSVVVAVGDRFTKGEVEAACRVLGLTEVPARLLYERGPREAHADALSIGAPAAA